MRCGVVFLWVAVPYRMTWRYSERGYRELHKDAGHVCQNLYLAAQAVGCGVCAIAAYDDDVMHDILGIDGVDQFLIYLATVGKTGPEGVRSPKRGCLEVPGVHVIPFQRFPESPLRIGEPTDQNVFFSPGIPHPSGTALSRICYSFSPLVSSQSKVFFLLPHCRQHKIPDLRRQVHLLPSSFCI